MQCELLFRSKTANFITAFVCSDFINGVMKNIIVTSNFNAICTNLDVHITREMRNNLLEHILTLFVRVRTFSFAKDIREKHKIGKKKQLRKRSLRTEMKSSSSTGADGRRATRGGGGGRGYAYPALKVLYIHMPSKNQIYIFFAQ